MNTYTTLTDQKDWLSITNTTSDTRLLGLLEDVSRWIDNETHRYFYTRTATLFADTNQSDHLLLPEDLISMTTITMDTEADGTYDGETWTEETDFWLLPYEHYPKTEIRLTNFGTYSFADAVERYVKMIGIWGHGDETSDPWEATSVTGTLSNATDTSLVFSVDGTIEPGHTLKLGTEQMFVTAVDNTSGVDTATVERGVNGTTAAVAGHAGVAISLALYPRQIMQACRVLTTTAFRQLGDEAMAAEGIGDYNYRRFNAANVRERERALIEHFRKRRFN